MRKIILLVAVFCLSTMLFADTAKSKSATLKFDMTEENYAFGFADNLDKAKTGTESTEFEINNVTKPVEGVIENGWGTRFVDLAYINKITEQLKAGEQNEQR